MGETKTAFSEKFHIHKGKKYINELRSESLNFTNLTSDNTVNYKTGTLRFNIGATTSVLDMRNGFFRVKWKYVKNNGTELVAGDITDRSGILIENNWFYKCFSHIVLRINGAEIERITTPGEVDSLLKHIYYPFLSTQVGDVSGWMPDKGDGRAINYLTLANIAADADVDAPAEVRVVLNNIISNLNTLTDPKTINTGFIDRKKRFPVAVLSDEEGYTQDFPIYPLFGFFSEDRVWKGLRFGFDFSIAGNYQSSILFGNSNSTDIALKILEVQVVIPTYEPTAPLLASINEQIMKELSVFYHNRVYNSTTIPAGTNSFSWELSVSPKRARYIFLWFKPMGRTGKRVNGDLYWLNSSNIALQAAPGDATDEEISAVTEFRLKEVQLIVDKQHYPDTDTLKLDPTLQNINEFIRYYQKVTKSSVPQYTTDEFLDIHSIVVFDLEAQKENRSNIGLNYRINIKKTGNQSLEAHCLILEETESILKVDRTVIRDVPL